MRHFRCLPIPSETAARWRATGRDDRGQALHRRVSDGGAPCRQCLRLAAPGEVMLLGSYELPHPQGVYWTPSPIFLHEAECQPWDAADEIAPIVLAPETIVSVRSYDAEEMCLYELGGVAQGPEAPALLARALADERARFINIHTARPGCLLCAVEKL
jgi:hypothetical protein